MKKYFSIINIHTLLVICVSLISSFISKYFHLFLNIDFIIVEIVIAFPLAFSLRVAFRRREVALRYLSLFKASLQSVVYAICDSKLDELKKSEFRKIATFLSEELVQYLARNQNDESRVQDASHLIYTFVRANRDVLKSRISFKIFLFVFRINESVEFLLATRRHGIPWGPKLVVLMAIYIFVIFYPAAFLNDGDASFSFLLITTAFRGFFLISFYNMLSLLEDPFNQKSPDGIRVFDFRPIYDSNTLLDISKVQPV
ncbi:MAG: hypothetical protein C5B59_20040 [Bacteroidetes bacterium]|nr:MAG: hypothetical protein C5B59_20040 [Bacteroidota bacterium]